MLDDVIVLVVVEPADFCRITSDMVLQARCYDTG